MRHIITFVAAIFIAATTYSTANAGSNRVCEEQQRGSYAAYTDCYHRYGRRVPVSRHTFEQQEAARGNGVYRQNHQRYQRYERDLQFRLQVYGDGLIVDQIYRGLRTLLRPPTTIYVVPAPQPAYRPPVQRIPVPEPSPRHGQPRCEHTVEFDNPDTGEVEPRTIVLDCDMLEAYSQ